MTGRRCDAMSRWKAAGIGTRRGVYNVTTQFLQTGNCTLEKAHKSLPRVRPIAISAVAAVKNPRPIARERTLAGLCSRARASTVPASARVAGLWIFFSFINAELQMIRRRGYPDLCTRACARRVQRLRSHWSAFIVSSAISPLSREPVDTDRKCVARIARLACLLYIITPSPGSAPVYSVNLSLAVSTAVINNACRLYTVSRLKAPCVLINRLLAFPSRELTISLRIAPINYQAKVSFF